MKIIKLFLKILVGENYVTEFSIYLKRIKYFFNKIFRNETNKYTSKKVKILRIKDSDVFFGYYDVSPFSNSSKIILANSHDGSENLDIGYFFKKEDCFTFKKVNSTKSWNFQMGCRLQWSNKKSNTIFYNDYFDNKYCTIEFDLNNDKIINEFQRPVYDQAANGEFFLSLDFNRLARLRPGYGYNNMCDTSQNQFIPNNNGIWFVNLNNRTEKLLFSVKEIADFTDFHDGEQYFNHIMISPESDKFIFFHISNINDKRSIRLLVYSFNDNKYKVINNSGHVSHCNWIDNNRFIAYATDNKLGTGFIIYDLSKGEIKKNIITNKLMRKDGHPSYYKSEDSFIIDTYPDKFGEQTLYKYNLSNDKVEIITKESLPARYYGETRCDLHPRLDKDEKLICIDTILDNQRIMKIINL